jgi:cytoskeletal protein RodZ
LKPEKIDFMETIGKLLKKLRQQQHLNINYISQETNISPHLITHLENDNFANLPSSTFTKGFITSYAKVVGLPSSKALAIFRRDFTVTESGKIMLKGLVKPLDKQTIITSKVLTCAAVGAFIAIFFIYLTHQFKDYNKAPEIEILKPKAHSIVKGPSVPIQGFVSADSTVYVNGNLAQVFPNGEFKAVATLPPGDHSISVKAINAQNKSCDQIIPIRVVDKQF